MWKTVKRAKVVSVGSILLTLLLGWSPGCAGPSTQLRVEKVVTPRLPKKARAIEYPSFWEAMENLDFSWLESHPVDEEQKQFGQALRTATLGQFSAAEATFQNLHRSSHDERMRKDAGEVLSYLLQAQSKWKTLSGMEELFADDDTNLLPTVRAFSQAPGERISFPPGPVTVPCTLSMTDTPVIEVEINGHKRSFWIDTGAGLSAVASDVAEEYGIRPIGQEKSLGATGTSIKVAMQPAVIDRLGIGGLVIENHPVVIVDEDDLKVKLFGLFTLFKVDGILGWPLLQKLWTKFDYRNRTVTMRKPEPSEPTERNLFCLGLPIARLAGPKGQELNFFLDTGGSTTVLHGNIFRKVPVRRFSTSKETLHSAGGSEDYLAKIVDELTLYLDDHRLRFSHIGSQPCHNKGGVVKLDGRLGNDIARNGAMVMDPVNGRLELIHEEGQSPPGAK